MHSIDYRSMCLNGRIRIEVSDIHVAIEHSLETLLPVLILLENSDEGLPNRLGGLIPYHLCQIQGLQPPVVPNA